MKHYLLFASHSYSYAIMRPLQAAIRQRGDVAAWYLEDSCPDWLTGDEIRLKTFEEVFEFDPIACIVPGNVVYDFFPGIKVEVFHGYPVQKRGEKVDENFRMRGWFDMYCSPGPSSTEVLSVLEKKHGYFKYYETGWMTSDAFFGPDSAEHRNVHTPPCVLYAPTFTKDVTSVYVMDKVIDELCSKYDWNWILSFHPLIKDEETIAKYKALEKKYPGRVEYLEVNKGIDRFLRSDVMLADSSGVICEFLMFGKPVVTYRNTCPGTHLIDCKELSEIPAALEKALARPADVMSHIDEYTHWHESFFDGKNSFRVLDAIDDFITNYKGKLKKKPLNLVRRIKLRMRLGYWKNFFGTR
ncbi:MAG: CDP-glycerol glycerophosphotransferase family protein [Bacteroidales bacterium]|nr:CDP-glycerol glycerophosphotransferase family protein [Bacteroidales bacterium]